MKEKIAMLQERLDKALPEDWEDVETHEDLYGMYERAFERALSVAEEALALLKKGGEPCGTD
jgi:hypothetical protein